MGCSSLSSLHGREPLDPQAALGEGRFDGKVLIVNSAADDSGNLVDSGAHPDQYRF